MTREEFIKRWRYHMVGGFTYGHVNDEKLGPVAKAQYQHEVTNHVENLLGLMFDSVHQQKVSPPAGRTNGITPAPRP